MRSALLCALVLATAACSGPTCSRATLTVQKASPTPSPSPTPTTPVALSATAPFHGGEVGIAYAPVALNATGGVQPYKWSISAGALPEGLTLGSDGTVSGSPTTAGNFDFTVQVADSGDSSATMPASVPIAAALSASLIASCATQCSVELGCVSVCGAFGQQAGGVGPYTYALRSGQLPSGTSLSGLGLAGTFTGLSGYLQFSVQVTDSLGATATVAPTFWMYQHIAMAGGRCGYGIAPCKINLPYSGGTPNAATSMNVDAWAGGTCYSPAGALVACPEPPISASVGGGVIAVTIDQYPPNSGYRNPQGTFTLSVTAQDPCGAGVQCKSGGVSLAVFYTG